MTRSSRLRRAAAVMTGLVLLAGCGSSPASSKPAASGGSPGAASALPDLVLRNVKTETANARAAAIGPDGGSVTATGSNGAVYTLTLPAGALAGTTQVALYPVSSVANLPTGASLKAAVQFSPEGLALLAPATLNIAFPAGVDAASLRGIAWQADGSSIHAAPAIAAGRTISLNVLHFSGDGAGDIPLTPLESCSSFDEQDAWLADAASLAAQPATAEAAFRDALTTCYTGYIAPALATGIHEATIGGQPEAEEIGFIAYSTWLAGISVARQALSNPAFAPAELNQSQTLGVTFLRAWFGYWNANCVAAKNLDWHAPVKFASLAVYWTRQPAVNWAVATAANQLDLQTILDQLCVKVVIDASRAYSAAGPSDDGTVTVKAGFTIDNGPVQTAAGAVSVKVSLTGTSTVVGEGLTDANGIVTADLIWPAGVDPIQIDLLATLIDTEPFVSGPIESIDVPTNIARVDRITKNSSTAAITPTPTQPPVGPLIQVQNTGNVPIVGVCQTVPIWFLNGVGQPLVTRANFGVSGGGTLDPTALDSPPQRIFRAGSNGEPGTGPTTAAIIANGSNAGSAAQLHATLAITIDLFEGTYRDAAGTTELTVVPGQVSGELLPPGTYVITLAGLPGPVDIVPSGLRLESSGGGHQIDLVVNDLGASGTIDGQSVNLRRVCAP